jgi:hypothetical protein
MTSTQDSLRDQHNTAGSHSQRSGDLERSRSEYRLEVDSGPNVNAKGFRARGD